MSTSDPPDKTSPDALARLAEGLVRRTTAPLIEPLEKLIGEGRIRDEDRPRMLIAILLVMLAPFALLGPQNDTLKMLLLAVVFLLVPVTWTPLLMKWRRRESTKTQMARLTLIVTRQNSKARGIDGAHVSVTGTIPIPHGDLITDRNGKVELEFAEDLIRQNHRIYVLAEKPGVGKSEEVTLRLSGQTEPVYLELLPEDTEPQRQVASDAVPSPESARGVAEPASPSDPVQLVQALANPDPLICLPAAQALRGRFDYVEDILNLLYSSTDPVQDAIRIVFGSVPELSARALVSAIAQCGVEGPTWHRAQRASYYFTPLHRPHAEKEMVDLLLSKQVEVRRHALVALGHMAVLHQHSPALDQILRSDDDYQKCGGFALEGLSRSYALADRPHDLAFASERLRDHLIEMGERERHASLLLADCSVRHVDDLLGSWLTADNQRVQTLGLEILGRLRVTRSAGAILAFLRACHDPGVAQYAATTLWKIGEPDTVRRMQQLGLDDSVVNHGIEYGLVSLDHSHFERILPQILSQENKSWLAYRAIGLRQASNKRAFLIEGLHHGQSVARAHAALALARLGDPEGDRIRTAFHEATDDLERMVTTLAVLRQNPVKFEDVEPQFRADLSRLFVFVEHEIKQDVIDVLQSSGAQRAQQVAEAWRPYSTKIGNLAL